MGGPATTPAAPRSAASAAPLAPPAPPAAPARRQSSFLPWVIVIVLLMLAGIGTTVFLIARHGLTPRVSEGGPAFCGINLSAPSVIYLLDRGNATETLFDPLKAACYKSLETLGPSRNFQVILWNNGSADVAYPPDSMHPASADEIQACRKTLEDIVATGNSHLRGVLEKALALHPAAIVIATGKSALDEDDTAALADAQKIGVVKIYAVAVGTPNPMLELAAKATGGQYRSLSERELRSVSQ